MKFIHIFETRKKRARGITVAYESIPRVPTSSVFYDVICGVAYCAPVERNYSRSLGRKISSNRLMCTKELVPTFRFQMVVSAADLKGVGMEYLVISELDRKLRGTMELLWAGSLVRRRLNGYLDPESKQEED